MRVGDTIELTNGKGTHCQATLTTIDERKTGYSITGKQDIPRRPYTIHLVIAPTKNMDRMEWLVEKVTEIGIDKITFIRCKTSERPSISLDRLQKLAISAMKQSKQCWLPELVDMVPFKEFLTTVTEEQRFIAHVDKVNPHHLAVLAKPRGKYVIMIGPEGDFTAEEVATAQSTGFAKVSLGSTRLRTETAGLFAVAILNSIQELKDG